MMISNFIFVFIISCLFNLTSTYKCKTHPAYSATKCLDTLPVCGASCEFCQDATCLECKLGYYLDFQKADCLPCSKGCSLCKGPAVGDCFGVQEGFKFQREGSILEQCELGCVRCNNHLGDCEACGSGEYSERGEKPGTIECHPCKVGNCDRCVDEKLTCATCKAGFKKVDGFCVGISGGERPCKKRSLSGEKCYDCPPDQQWSDK